MKMISMTNVKSDPITAIDSNYVILDDFISLTYQEWLLSLIKDDNLMWHRKDSAIMDANSADPRNGFCNFHYMYECVIKVETYPH